VAAKAPEAAPEADQKRPDLVEHDDQQEQEQAQPAAPSRTTEQLMAAAIGADAAAGEAFLRINSRPWSQVFIDGTLVGTTPKIDLRVSAGPHRVRLVNPELGLSKTFQVDASAGQTIAHVEHLDE
jgi:serine/threonine-protein kinase